jgi:fumarate reductase subunit D
VVRLFVVVVVGCDCALLQMSVFVTICCCDLLSLRLSDMGSVSVLECVVVALWEATKHGLDHQMRM